MIQRRHRTFHCVFLLGLLAWVWPGSARAQVAAPAEESSSDATVSGSIPVLVTGDLTGRLSRLECGDPPQVIGGLPAIARRAALETSLLVDNGNLLGTDGFGRYVLSRPDGARELGELVAEVGYHAVLPGMRELAVPPEKLGAYLKAAADGGTHVVAANLSCSKDSPAPGCDRVEPSAVIELSVADDSRPTRIAVIGVVAPDVLERIPPRYRGGWAVSDPVEAARKELARYRGRVDHVVVLSHLEGRASAPRRTWELARQISGWDLLVGNAFTEGPDVEATIESLSLMDAPGRVVGTAKYAYEVTVAHLGGGETVVDSEPMDQVLAMPATGVGAGVYSWARTYCEELDVSIGGARFEGTWTEDDLRTHALFVMRERTQAELAILNRDHIRLGDNTLEGDVTRNLLFRAFPFADPIGTAKVSGAVLRSLLTTHSTLFVEPGPHTLAVVGVTRTDGKLLVNGRDLDDSATYRVAMTSFLAEGGDGFLPPQPGFSAVETADGQEVALREAVTEHFEAASGGDVAVSKGFADLSRRPLWTLYADAQVAFDTVSVSHGEQYASSGQTQLSQTPFTGQSYRGAAKALMDTRNVAWHNNLDLKYALSKAKDADPVESADVIHFNSLFTARHWKKPGKRLAPVPYTELDLETEFTTANPYDPQPEDFHHFLTTGTLGVRSEVLPKVDLFFGAGVQSELLQPKARGKFGVNAGYRLQPVQITSGKRFRTTFESNLGYFRSIPATAAATDRLTWTNKVNFLIFGYLTAGLAFDAFAYRDESIGPWGTSTQLTFTLGAAWSDRVQTW